MSEQPTAAFAFSSSYAWKVTTAFFKSRNSLFIFVSRRQCYKLINDIGLYFTFSFYEWKRVGMRTSCNLKVVSFRGFQSPQNFATPYLTVSYHFTWVDKINSTLSWSSSFIDWWKCSTLNVNILYTIKKKLSPKPITTLHLNLTNILGNKSN